MCDSLGNMPFCRLDEPSAEQRQAIFRQHQRGWSVVALAERFARPPACICRIVRQAWAERVMGIPLDYVPNDQYSRVCTHEAEQEILSPPPPAADSPREPPIPPGLPGYLLPLYDAALPTAAEERHWFRKMNYMKYKADSLRGGLDRHRPSRALLSAVERCCEEAAAVRKHILHAYRWLVVSVARQFCGNREDFFALVAEGNAALAHAVETYDFAQPLRFRAYASRAIGDAMSRLPGAAANGGGPQRRKECRQERIRKCRNAGKRARLAGRFALRHGEEPGWFERAAPWRQHRSPCGAAAAH